MAKPNTGATKSRLSPGTITLKELIRKNHACSEKVISDLKAGLQRDFTIIEACTYAGINPDTYYRWIKESDEFAAEMQKAQQFMSEKAKGVIMDALQMGDKDAAKWWLERRRKESYSLRNEVTGKDGEPVIFTWGDPRDE